jgi:hypothetical protein
MTDYDWAQIRTTAIRRLGETPNAPIEHDITETFKDNPQLVSSVIDAVIAEKASGVSFRSAWAVIRYRSKTNPAEPIVATDHRERDLRTRQSEAWIRNAGLYIDVERELVSELFDEGGMLHPWRSEALEARMVTLWENERPRGQQAERDVITRAEGRKAIRALQQEAQRSKPTPPEKTSSAPSGASTQPPAKTPTATTPSTPQPTKTPSATPSVPSRDSVATTTQPSKSPAEPDSDPHWHQRPEPESDPTWHVRPEPEVTA